MKRILLAVGLGLGILTVSMADAANYTTAPGQITKNDTTPTDTTQPTPAPDTSSFQINR